MKTNLGVVFTFGKILHIAQEVKNVSIALTINEPKNFVESVITNFRSSISLITVEISLQIELNQSISSLLISMLLLTGVITELFI